MSERRYLIVSTIIWTLNIVILGLGLWLGLLVRESVTNGLRIAEMVISTYYSESISPNSYPTIQNSEDLTDGTFPSSSTMTSERTSGPPPLWSPSNVEMYVHMK